MYIRPQTYVINVNRAFLFELWCFMVLEGLFLDLLLETNYDFALGLTLLCQSLVFIIRRSTAREEFETRRSELVTAHWRLKMLKGADS